MIKEGALIPPRLFRNVGFVSITICATIGAMVYYSMTVLWPTIIGTVYTSDVVAIGWQSSVVGGGICLGQLFGGFGLSYIPKVKWQSITVAVCSMAFVSALASISETQHSAFIAFGVLGCFFIGYLDNIMFPAITLVIEPQDIGLATGVLGSMRGFGGAVAQSLYVSLLNTKVGHYLPKYVTPAAVQSGLPASSLPSLFAGITTGNLSAVPNITPAIIGVVAQETKHAYIDSFHIVFYATIPFSVLLIVAACFVPNMEGVLTSHVAKRLQHMGGEAKDGKMEVTDVLEKQAETTV